MNSQVKAFACVALFLVAPKSDVHAQINTSMIDSYERRAASGDIDAQNQLGIWYQSGVTTWDEFIKVSGRLGPDFVKAAFWYKKAAEQGHSDSALRLAQMYREGSGVPRNYSKALQWHREAAESGNPEAQFTLGELYEKGISVRQDFRQAARWYSAAADYGDWQSQEALGELYAKGMGVPKSLVSAYMWINLAASRNASLTSRRDSLEAQLTPAQIAEAQRLSHEWKPKKQGK